MHPAYKAYRYKAIELIDVLQIDINQPFAVAFLSCLDGTAGTSIVFCPHFFKKCGLIVLVDVHVFAKCEMIG